MKTARLSKILVTLLLIIFGGVVLHAPLTVGLGVLLPEFSLIIKAWKEILMGVALVLLLVLVYRKRSFTLLLSDWIIRLVIAYGAIHIACLLLWQGFAASVSGMLIDLRYILFFVLVYVTLRLFPAYRRLFVTVGISGALVVLLFAVLQVFVLPVDVLSYIGYSKATIVPYLTVDLNPDYIRINSTLRGPNPLGAYAATVLALTAAYMVRNRVVTAKARIVTGILLVGGMTAVWTSYSRSALMAAAIMLVIVLLVSVGRKLPRMVWIATIVVVFALGGGLFAARDSHFVSNVLLHENPTGGSAEKSNDGHVDSLHDGTARLLRQPVGAGVGSTGSASLYGDEPVIIENQYLFIAHETGWIGLLTFIALFGLILKRLWAQRKDWLSLGAFASGIGLAAIGILLPVWVDDTVSIIWWGLAAAALGSRYGR